MREIKFRAWGIMNKRFIISRDIKESTIDVVSTSNGFKLRSEMILQQFTGLLDKNGKEIYEGDIVRCFQFKHYSNDKEEKIKCVVFYNNAFVFECMDGTGYGKLSGAGYEVIGNIYENKELLK